MSFVFRRFEAVRNNTGFTDFFFTEFLEPLTINDLLWEQSSEDTNVIWNLKVFIFFQTKNEANRDDTCQPDRRYNQLPKNV